MKFKYGAEILITALLCLLLPAAHVQAEKKVPTPVIKSPVYSGEPSFTISGLVLNREEKWDRRSNPLMGRPDVLKEIILHVRVLLPTGGKIPSSMSEVLVSISDQNALIKHKSITTGSRGTFRLSGQNSPYKLLDFEPFKSSGTITPAAVRTQKPRPTPRLKATPTPRGGPLLESEKISGRDIIKSKELQEKAVREIAKKYGMTNASFVSMTSFSGPMPPNGGYKYWGVKGDIKGAAYIWQYGYGLRAGSSLEDPQRYNKCNSPETLITTPGGRIAIKDLNIGDLVISERRAVPIISVSKVKVASHSVCRLLFNDGTVLYISPGHPLPDGRLIGGLKCGDMLDGKHVIKNSLAPYTHEFTYDILPDSVSGSYLANGICVGSTLEK